MNLNFVHSLEHLTLAKISIILCNSTEIKLLLEETRGFDSSGPLYAIQQGNYFQMFERSRHAISPDDDHAEPCHEVIDDLLELVQDRVRAMISPLNFGASFRRKILSFIPHTVLEIQKWKENHSMVLSAMCDVQVYFCWKSLGTIDRERTAENLLSHGNLSLKSQFFLASLYCMQSRLSSLWEKISDSYKSYLISSCHKGSLLNYWTSRLDGFHPRRVFPPDALYITNVSALQYFYNECGREDEKQALLNNVLNKHGKNIDLVHFCVTKLCQNGPEELSSLQCHAILRCFLNWPWQTLFLDVSECLIVKLDETGMNDLLHEIFRITTIRQYEDFNFLNLLKELWKQIPSHCKDSLMNTPDFRPIKAVLQQASAKLVTPEWFH